MQQPEDVLGGDPGQLGDKLLDLRVELVHVVLVYRVDTERGRLGGVRLLSALLQLLHKLLKYYYVFILALGTETCTYLRRGVRTGAPEDPQFWEVDGQQLQPRHQVRALDVPGHVQLPLQGERLLRLELYQQHRLGVEPRLD